MLVFLKDNMTTAERGESLLNKHTGSTWAIPSSLSPYGVSSRESHLLQHYASEYSQVSDFNTPAHRSNIENMARIALAIDYDGNVHRSFLPMAMSHRALLNAIFAASSAHLSRWQNKADTSSHRYAIQALVELEKSLRDPVVASSETTLATMLCLIGLEVGNGSTKWRHHYRGLEEWLRWKGDTAKLDPFLKSWILLAAYQAAMVFGEEPTPAIYRWFEVEGQLGVPQDQVIDPFLGYSVKLPGLLLRAASLHRARRNSSMSEHAISHSVSQLQQQIESCKIDCTKPILLASAFQPANLSTVANTSLCQTDLWKRAAATAEIFRHAAHIYVHRVNAHQGEPLPVDIQHSVDEILNLLNLIPDTRGPGSNLAWPLFTVGLELDSPELRGMVLDWWQILHLLGMESTRKTERVLVETWRHRDEAKEGRGVAANWQEVMRGQEQMVA
uniref:Transcription factor domain-containing protein n=1 Tax=Bionectria ochroleuca TaxID=29856 RepID=A0A0B7KJQ6_BIOOC